MNLKTLKSRVENVLSRFPETRDSDITLTIRVWKEFHRDKLFTKDAQDENKCYIYLKDLFNLPREDNIKRIRAKIQNEEGKHLPTSWEVAEKRGILEGVWREFMGKKTIEKPKAIKEIITSGQQMIGGCPACGGGLYKKSFFNETTNKMTSVVVCADCNKQMY